MSVDKKVPEIRFEEFSGKWEAKKLGELAEILRGASPRPIEDPKWFDSNSSVGWLRIRDVTEQDGRISYLEQRISKLGQEKTRVLHTKSLLLSIAASVGKPVINYVETGVHDGFLIFKKPFFEIEFMYQWLKSFEEKWKQYGQPGSQVNLNSDIVKSQSVTLPTKKEQTQIGNYFQKLDTLINQHQKKHDKLCNIKKAMLEKMFPKQGETIPEIRFKGFSGEWEKIKFKDIAEIKRGLTYKPTDLVNEGVVVLRSSNINIDKFELRKDDVQVDKKVVNINYINNGDILITSANGSSQLVGKHAIVKNLNSDSVHGGFMLAATTNAPDFLNASMNTYWYNRFLSMNVSGGNGAIGNIKGSILEEELLYVPKKDEQDKISNYFQKLDTLIDQHHQQITKLNNIKQACLSKMFV